MRDQDQKAILEMTGIHMRFPGVYALKNCSFSLRSGEIHALVGENGAGKSTLMKVLTGIYKDYSGQIRYDGSDVRFHSIKDAQQQGISMVHQELNLLNHMTVAQNIFIGRESDGFFLNDRAINQKAAQLIDGFHIHVKPTDLISSLTVGKLQMVEIVRAMSFKATKVLILDEPTAALCEWETDELFEKLRHLRSKGVAIIYISHRMAELRQIADRITVLRDGEYVGTMDAQTCDNAELIRMMVGRTVFHQPKEKSAVAKNAPVVLRVEHLASPDVRDVSFSLKRGEILGFSGLVGAGRTEVMRLLFGADPMSGGQVEINGKPVRIRTPADAVKNGIGYLSEDRKRYGLGLGLSVLDNIILGAIDKCSRLGLVHTKVSRKTGESYRQALNIKTPSLSQLAKFLSGGNQQKLIIAKWLLMDMDILIFDEPTRGIDVGAKSEIYELMDSLVSEGKSIIMVSSELPEILRMSDRVIVMCEGRKTIELDISQANSQRIMEYATCVSEE